MTGRPAVTGEPSLEAPGHVGSPDVEELEDRRRFLLRSLRDLEEERESGDIDPDDYQRLRDRYTVDAAAVLRQLAAVNGGDTSEAGGVSEPPIGVENKTEGRPGIRHRVVVAAGVSLVAAVAAVGVVLVSAPRVADQPATGSVGPETVQQLARAHQLEAEGQILEAIKLYDTVLAAEPDNVEALAYRGWILRLAGASEPLLIDRAQQSLDRAVAVDPRYPDARFFRGLLLFEDRGNPQAAIADFEAFLASNPPPAMVGPVQDVLNRARAAAGTATPTAP